MKKIIKIISVSIVGLTIASCSVTRPVTTSNNAIGSKVGVSETMIVLGIQLNGKYGITEAVQKGKIKGGVSTVDVKFSNFVFFQKKEMFVTGE